jgi:hypothetical protein
MSGMGGSVAPRTGRQVAHHDTQNIMYIKVYENGRSLIIYHKPPIGVLLCAFYATTMGVSINQTAIDFAPAFFKSSFQSG